MRKVVLYSLVSADGVAESPDRYVLEFDDQMRQNLAMIIGTQDVVLLGRGSYDDWAGYWPHSTEEPFAPFINTVEKYVFTSSPLDPTWKHTTVVNRPARSVIEELKIQPGKDIGVHGSLGLARSLLAEGLIDEVRLTIAPTFAGSGRRLFPDSRRRRADLIQAEQTPSGALLVGYRLGTSLG